MAITDLLITIAIGAAFALLFLAALPLIRYFCEK